MNEPKLNIGVEHGAWGERVAVDWLRRRGYEIIDRNSRPVARDARLEIDIVAYDPKREALVFVEVKQHAMRSIFQRRLRSVDKNKKRNLRRACNAWRRGNKWQGGYRFDVIEVYGRPGMRAPEIDHIEDVRLFVDPVRFVTWG